MGLFGPSADERAERASVGQLRIVKNRQGGLYEVQRRAAIQSVCHLSFYWAGCGPYGERRSFETEAEARKWVEAEQAGDEIIATFAPPCGKCGQ